MKRSCVFGVVLVIWLSHGGVEGRTIHRSSPMVRRQVRTVNNVCTIISALVNTLASLVNYIVHTAGNLISQTKVLIANVKRDVLNLGRNIAPAVITCLNGLLDEILQLPVTVKDSLERCVQGLTTGLSLGTASLCATLAGLDAVLTTCFAASQTMTVRCLVNGLLDLGASLLGLVRSFGPLIGILLDGIFGCADEVLGQVFGALNRVILVDVDACRAQAVAP